MKDHPVLVDDFFGRSVVAAFCGLEAAAGLGQPLDGRGLADYRRRLFDLYAAVFTEVDPACRSRPGYRTLQWTCGAVT